MKLLHLDYEINKKKYRDIFYDNIQRGQWHWSVAKRQELFWYQLFIPDGHDMKPLFENVEKELNITKEDIGDKISIEKYNNACKSAVMRYTDVWNDLTKKIGFWVDMDNPYVTYKTKYIERVWWLLKEIYDKGLIYKGYSVQPYSPKAGTGLSSHELNQPGTYRDVSDCLLYTSPSPRDFQVSRMPSSA